jgi:hypothetical protein
MAEVVSSPLRQRIVREVVTHYALVVLFEGTDVEGNERAFQEITDAIREVDTHLSSMPKPISRGAAALRIRRDEAEDDRVLLWSVDPDRAETAMPRAVVLYGRARRLGPVLRGDEISRDVIVRILAVIGADCECGLDPELIRGMPLPVTWHRTTRDQVADELGFDPESPMVKTEISQILRLRSRLWPEPAGSTGNRGAAGKVDDFPVPFVEDIEAQEREDARLRRFVYVSTVTAVVILAAGAVLMIRARRRVL